MKRRELLLALAASALAPPAFAGTDWSKKRKAILAGVHTLGVIVALGDHANYERIGVTEFGNAFGEIDITSWGLDDLIQRGATAALTEHGYAVKPIDYDRKAFADTGKDTGWFRSGPSIYSLVEGRADRDGVDAYIALVSGRFDDIIGMTNQTLRGLGMYRHLYGFSHIAADFAFVLAAVTDPSGKALVVDDLVLGETQYHDPIEAWERMDTANFPENFEDMTDAQRAFLRARLTAMLTAGITPTLARLGFDMGPQAAVEIPQSQQQ